MITPWPQALFSHLEDADMDMLVDSMGLKTFQPGDVMIHEEVPSHHLIEPPWQQIQVHTQTSKDEIKDLGFHPCQSETPRMI